QQPAAAMGEVLDAQAYLTEARVPEGSAAVGKSIAELGDLAEGVSVTSVLREGEDREASCDTVLRAGDIVLLEGAPDALQRTIAKARLELEGQDRTFASRERGEEIGVIEAVIAQGSTLIGEAAGRLELHRRHDINLLAVSRNGVRFTERLGSINLRAGDVIVLQGPLSQLPAKLRELGCLPLAEREVRLGKLSRSVLPLAILAG